MKKRGFTLVELIAIMVILGILTLITVPIILNSIKRARQNTYNTNISMIKTALQGWKNDHTSLVPKRGEKIYLTIAELKRENYLEQEMINPLTTKPFPNDMLLTITNNNGSYEYDVDVNSGTETDKYEGLTPYLLFDTPIRRTISVGGAYVPPNVKAYYGDGRVADVEITSSLIEGTSVSTSSPGIYYVLYKATIGDIPVSLVQTIAIEPVDSVCNVSHATSRGIYTAGDTYICDPGDGTDRTFYVLSVSNEVVSLIMDKNLGTNVAWNESGLTENGPESALSYLKGLTSNWVNVSVTIPEAATIAAAAGVSWNPDSSSPALSGWLYANSTSGYWTSTPYGDSYAFAVDRSGSFTNTHAVTSNDYGVRPVIVVSKDKIAN
ncbi:MAG: prepilin-type N-terminal cleavage/methylation domain-containing protein [Bacilli bacterium]|nr:prepilin-type N-terminal cleavage/methylation domain-containing protein [Bacilli bacterium]